MLVSKHIQRMTFVQPKLAKVLLLAEIISTEVWLARRFNLSQHRPCKIWFLPEGIQSLWLPLLKSILTRLQFLKLMNLAFFSFAKVVSSFLYLLLLFSILFNWFELKKIAKVVVYSMLYLAQLYLIKVVRKYKPKLYAYPIRSYFKCLFG